MTKPGFLHRLFGRAGATASRPALAGAGTESTQAAGEASVPSSRPPGLGEFLGQYYEVCAVLGRGGFGQVYLVCDRRGNSVFALKTFRDEFLANPLIRAQFRLEAEAWIHLGRHPCLVRAEYVEALAGRLYLVMEYVPPDERGRNNLEQHLRSAEADLGQALVWAVQICQGMEHAYRQGLRCHRDLKPANILVGPDGCVKITDFGLARVLDRAEPANMAVHGGGRLGLSGSPDGDSFGTPTHMPPEQFENAAGCDQRSDIYSFGVILFQLASGGRLPFLPAMPADPDRASEAALWREFHRLHSREAVPRLDTPLMPIIDRCLAKRPIERYVSFEALRADLERLLKEKTGRTVRPVQQQELQVLDLIQRAYSLNRLGRFREALESYDKALVRMPGLGQPWRGKGAALAALGRPSEALRCFDEALKIDPADATAWCCKGGTLMQMGRLEDAVVCLDRALELGLPDADTFCNKANALSALGRYEEAVASAEQCLSLNLAHAAGWCEKGRALHALGQLAEAVPCYDRSLRIDPYLPVAWYNKALIAEGRGDRARSVEYHRRFVELAPASSYGPQIAHSKATIQQWAGPRDRSNG